MRAGLSSENLSAVPWLCEPLVWWGIADAVSHMPTLLPHRNYHAFLKETGQCVSFGHIVLSLVLFPPLVNYTYPYSLFNDRRCWTGS